MPIDTLYQQAHTALQESRFEECLNLAKEGIELQPEIHEFYFLSAFSYAHLEQMDQALVYQQKAIQYAPDNAAYHFNAAVYAGNLDTKEMELRSMLYYQRALRLEPDYADALWNYSELLRLNGHIHLAIDCLNHLIELDKIFPMLYNRLVACYECIDATEQTDALYERLLTDESDVIAAWGYATEHLRRENFAEGWKYYNRRFNCSYLNNAYYYPFDLPFWSEEFIPDMTLLIHGEQGLGDEMMFASTFNELIQEAKTVNAKIIIGCKPPLARLFQTSFPDTQVIAHQYKEPADISHLDIDLHLPMGNLIAHYRQSISDFKAHQDPYLFADASRAAYYEEMIVQKGRQSIDGKRRLRVGLMWTTVANETVGRFVLSANRRSIPAHQFAQFEDLVDDVEFISLQNYECGSQAAIVPQLNIIDFSLDQADFYDTAAIIHNLDLVITIDTSIFHLAAAMGKETWVALTKRPEWRFGRQDRTESYWYGKTQYFRQTRQDQWTDVIDHIHEALAERVKTK